MQFDRVPGDDELPGDLLDGGRLREHVSAREGRHNANENVVLGVVTDGRSIIVSVSGPPIDV